MAMTIAALYRYPVKGLSPEKLERVKLLPGECLPHDRRFAIALPSTEFDPDAPKWAPKRCFAMLMRDEKLALLDTRFDPASEELTIARAGSVAVRGRLDEAEGRRAVADFVGAFLGEAIERPLRVVAAEGHAFADARHKPNATTDKYVSLINLNSIAALAERVGKPIDPLRFRANVYFNGAPAWQELEWMESRIRLGGARLRVIAAITRCAATQVNLQTAERDIDVPAALVREFGHNLLGIYAEVTDGGDIAVGDELALLGA